jgi:hypothetical protein
VLFSAILVEIFRVRFRPSKRYDPVHGNGFLAVMTVDGILAFLLAVGIPFLLASAGGYLAVKALPKEDTAKRRGWIVLFAGLFLIGAVLGIWQQVRATDQQKKSDELASSREQRLITESKYTQGKLDSITLVLGKLISQPDSKQSNIKPTLDALLSATNAAAKQQPSPPAARDIVLPYPENLSNSQLKVASERLVREMKIVVDRAETEDRRNSDQLTSDWAKASQSMTPEEIKQKWPEFTTRMFKRSMDLATNVRVEFSSRFMQECVLLRNEMLSRLPSDLRTEDKNVNPDNFYVAPPNNLVVARLIVSDMERLASRIPAQ